MTLLDRERWALFWTRTVPGRWWVRRGELDGSLFFRVGPLLLMVLQKPS